MSDQIMSFLPRLQDARGHQFERFTKNRMPVLRCAHKDCGLIWWPDQRQPTKRCPGAKEVE